MSIKVPSDWKLREAHDRAVRPIVGDGREWGKKQRDALKASGHTSVGYETCECRAKTFEWITV